MFLCALILVPQDDITSEDPDVRRFSTNMEILRDMLIYNIARKWSLFSPVEMYHCALAFHVLAVKVSSINTAAQHHPWLAVSRVFSPELPS